MHLMTFVQVAKPNLVERWLILIAQTVFWNLYFVIYVFVPRTCHRLDGYFEEETIISDSAYLDQVLANPELNIAAPQILIDYWHLAADARLADVIIAVRHDEQDHGEVNHGFAEDYDLERQRS